MKSDVVKFFNLQHQMFGICPKCQDFFRLSDCKIFIKKKPVADWMDKITLEEDRIEEAEEKLEEKKKTCKRRLKKKGATVLKWQ